MTTSSRRVRLELIARKPALWWVLLLSGIAGGALFPVGWVVLGTASSPGSGTFPEWYVLVALAIAGALGGGAAAGMAIALRAIGAARTNNRILLTLLVLIGAAVGGVLDLVVQSGGLPQAPLDFAFAAGVTSIPLSLVAVLWHVIVGRAVETDHGRVISGD